MSIRPSGHFDFQYEISSPICKHIEKLKSQNMRIKNKHFSFLNITSCLIDFLLILCSLRGNTRDVTAKQIERAVPI